MKLTESPAFRRWFGDSKVVDENGEPLVVWHGHPEHVDTFYEFDFNRSVDVGMHFGTKEAARQAASGLNPTVRPFFLNITNPFVASDPGDWISGNPGLMQTPSILDQMGRKGVVDRKEYDEAFDLIESFRQEAKSKSKWLGENDAEWKKYRSKASELLRKLLLKHGYDGVVYKNETEQSGSISWIAFGPTQIKSATDNQGTFDPTNPDVRKNPSKMLRLYHRTTPEKAAQIESSGLFRSEIRTSLGQEVYFSDRLDEATTGYGAGVVVVDIPERFATLDDEFPSGEKHYWVEASDLSRYGKIVEARRNPARAARSYQAREMVPVRYGDDVEMVEQSVWKSDPAYLTEGHFDLEEVKDATRIAEQVFAFQEGHKRRGDVRVTLLGQGNFGRVYKAEMPAGALSVKLPAPTDVRGTRWTRAKIRPLFIHEAGIANEVSDKGFNIVPRSIYVELYDGTPAIVREYGEPVHSLSPDEFYEIEQKLVEIEDNGFRVQDDIHLYRREDGTIYVGDVGIWQPEGKRLKPHKKGWMDTSLPALLGLLARDTLGIQTISYSSLPGLILTANRLKEAVDEYDPNDKSLFLKMSLEDAIRSIENRRSLNLPVPSEILRIVDQAQRLMP